MCQPGQGVDDQPVRLSQLNGTSLHQLKAARILNVLFTGRSTQVEALSYQPLMQALLSNSETAVEFLDSLGVVLE